MQEVDDGDVVREIPLPQLPDPGPPVPHERPVGGIAEVAPPRLGGDHRAELVAAAGAGHIGPDQQFRPPPLLSRRFGGRGRLPRGASGRRLGRAHGTHPTDPTNQLLDVLPVAEAGRQLRLGIGVGGGDRRRGQHRDLILAPRGVMSPGPIALLADAQPSPIDLDHRQRRPRFDPGREFAGLGLPRAMIPPGLQLLTDLLGDAAGLATADGQFGQVVEDLGRLLKGGFPGTGADDLAEDRRAGVMRCEAQTRALRGKNPGDTPGIDTWVPSRPPHLPRTE